MAEETRRTLNHHAYTVGWLCPLRVEMVAARCFLDEEHKRLPRVEGDSNTYVLGEINGHNVAIASLPAGFQGTISAAVVASNMSRTFGSIKHRFLVGIGGGVPNEDHDIRLGDVVVAVPTKTNGGVIQYDLGKQTSNGFERRGFLSPPPMEWLHIINMMRSDHEHARGMAASPSKIAQLLHEKKQKYPRFEHFQRPPSTRDILFRQDYNHLTDERTCDKCDRLKTEIRAERELPDEPEIYYGLIASGNRVMKDAAERDRISKECGGAICFETESAGLMNDFGSVVVRGISDYSDSHKNDEWHEYAAASAAAAAKELLMYLNDQST